MATSPAVLAGWDQAVEVAEAGISAAAAPFTSDWAAGMSDGRFAAMLCPSW